jgi:hypothetical protein
MSLPLAYGDVKCPDISIAAQYISPVTKAKKITCGYMSNNRFIKHGQEIEFDKSDKVVKTNFYVHNKLETAPETEEETFKVIHEVLRIFPYEKSVSQDKLKISTCDSDKKTWVKKALISQSVQKTYTFSKKCDLSGTFSATLLGEFPVNLEMKNLDEYKFARMRVRMYIDQTASGILYQFKVREGEIISRDKTITFKAKYEVKFDPLTGSTKFATQNGEISLTKVGDRILNLSKPLLFTR